MAIDKRFLYYTTEAGFLSDKNKGNIDDKSIAFISTEGKRAIYTHGVYFAPDAFVVGTQTSQTNEFTGEFNEIDKLYDGLSIKYWIPFNGTTSSATLNLTINGTQTGAIPVYLKGTTRFTNHIGAYNVLHLTYRENVGSIQKGWWVLGSYGDASDGNTTYSFTSGEDGSFKVKPSNGTEQTISIGKPSTAETADKVKNSLTIQINSGSEEDVELYEYDGSTPRFININSGSNISFNTSDGDLTISSDYQDATQTSSGLMSATDKIKLDNLEDALGNVMYDSAMDDSLATLTALGGIPAGTTAATLKTKTLSAVFDDLLFPTVQPTVVAPSASLSLKSTSTTPTVQEVGTTGSTVPVSSSFNTGFSKGEIRISGKKKQDRSGSSTSTVLYYGSSISNTTLPTVIPDGSISYKYRVNYAAGPTPLDSKGNTATSYSALAAGYVDSAAVVVYGVYPYFANSSNNNSFNKLSLTTSTTLSAVKFVAEGPNKHAFKLPAKYTLTKTELLNTLSGNYETFATSNWTVTTENITVQGNTVSYKVYTRNDSGFNGESTYNITFSK